MPSSCSKRDRERGAEPTGAVSCGAMHQVSQETRAGERDAPSGVAKKLPTPFHSAVKILLGTPVTRAALIALFGSRATFTTIQNWRYGRADPPQWAIDMLRAHAELRARAILEHAAAVERKSRTRAENAREQARRINARRTTAETARQIR